MSHCYEKILVDGYTTGILVLTKTSVKILPFLYLENVNQNIKKL